MLENLNYTGKNGVLLEYDMDTQHKQIMFSDVESLWEYANEDCFEGGNARFQDNYIIFSMLTASGQGGIIVVWDTLNDKVIHVSEAAYCEAAIIYKDIVCSLYCVSNYSVPFHYEVYITPLGTMDACESGKRGYCISPCHIEDTSINKLELEIVENKLYVVINNYKLLYADSFESIKHRNEKYAWLYEVMNEDSSSHAYYYHENGDKFGIDLSIKSLYGWLT